MHTKLEPLKSLKKKKKKKKQVGVHPVHVYNSVKCQGSEV